MKKDATRVTNERYLPGFLLCVAAAAFIGCGGDQPASHEASPPQKDGAVVFRAADGRTLAMADLRGLSGTIPYEIEGNSKVPAEAESLHQEGRQAGAAGDYKKAIALLERARSLAPTWPFPVYDTAFTYLLMKDDVNARKFYQKTIELAPRGYYTAITALAALDRESKGDLPVGTYLSYVSLDWMNDPAKKAEAIRQMVKQVPGFAPGWYELAGQVHSEAERSDAIEKGLAARPDAETKGVLLINKALIMDRSGDHAGAVRLLGELALDPASTISTEHMAKITLAGIVEKK